MQLAETEAAFKQAELYVVQQYDVIQLEQLILDVPAVPADHVQVQLSLRTGSSMTPRKTNSVTNIPKQFICNRKSSVNIFAT